MKDIATCLWFDKEAEDAVRLYTSVFKNSKIGRTAYYTEVGHDIHGMPAGSIMTIEFSIEGREFMALNGGPIFKFTEAVSLMVPCDSQEEIDYYWNKLSAGGDVSAQQCGWLKDRFGLSWQITPRQMGEWMSDATLAPKLMEAFMPMKKLDMNVLQKIARGG